MSNTFSPEFARKNQHHAQTLHTIEMTLTQNQYHAQTLDTIEIEN